MTLYDYIGRQIPNYYPTMYLDGYTPEQILSAVRGQMKAQMMEAAPTDYNIHITSEVKK